MFLEQTLRTFVKSMLASKGTIEKDHKVIMMTPECLNFTIMLLQVIKLDDFLWNIFVKRTVSRFQNNICLKGLNSFLSSTRLKQQGREQFREILTCKPSNPIRGGFDLLTKLK